MSARALLLMMMAICVALLHAGSAAAEPAGKEYVEKWMNYAQEVLNGVRIGPLKENFTPQYMQKRSLRGALGAQISRARAQLLSTMLETLGDRAIICFGRRFDDQALIMLKAEVESRGFKVDWTPAQAHDSAHERYCNSSRQTMVVHVPPVVMLSDGAAAAAAAANEKQTP